MEMDLTITQLQQFVLQLDTEDLVALNIDVAKELARRSKGMGKAKAAKTGVLNPGLAEFGAFGRFVYKEAKENGWEAFEAKAGEQVNAETGKKEKIVQEMPASICRDGVHVYPNGQNFTTANGNSLAAKYKAENHPIYQDWKASYVAADVPEKETPAVVRVSAAAASAEKQAKEAALAEKRAKAAEAKAAREEAAKAKAAEKLKKAQDALEKAQKQAEEAAQPKAKVVGRVKSASPPPKAEAAAAAVPLVVAVASPVKAAIKAPTTVKLAPKKKAEEAEIPFNLADDADAGNWIFKGKAVIRTRANLMYVDLGDKEEDPVGEFMGVYDPATKTLDDSMTEEEAQELADA